MPKAKTTAKKNSTKKANVRTQEEPEKQSTAAAGKNGSLTESERAAMAELADLAESNPPRSIPLHGNAIQMGGVHPKVIPLDVLFYHPGRDPLMRTRKVTQTRVGFDEEYAKKDLAELLKEDPNFEFDPIEAVYDPSTGLIYITDGFHRLTAYRHVGRETVPVRLAEGTETDALKVAAGSNSTHGKRRTKQDKRKAVTMLLEHPDTKDKSDNYIAKCANVSQPFVGTVRAEVQGDNAATERVGADGKTRSVPTSRKGSTSTKAEAVAQVEARPEEKYITEDGNGAILPDHLQPVFTCGKDVAARINQLKRDVKELNAIVEAYSDKVDSPALLLPIEEGIAAASKEIVSALNRLNREALPKYISPYTKGTDTHPDDETRLAPVEGYTYPDGTMINIGWVSDTQYKESPEDLRNDPELMHYDYDFGTEEAEDEETDELGTFETDDTQSEIETEADPELMQDSPDEEESEKIDAFA